MDAPFRWKRSGGSRASRSTARRSAPRNALTGFTRGYRSSPGTRHSPPEVAGMIKRVAVGGNVPMIQNFARKLCPAVEADRQEADS